MIYWCMVFIEFELKFMKKMISFYKIFFKCWKWIILYLEKFLLWRILLLELKFVFLNLGDYLMVMLFGYFVYLLNVGIEFELC